MGGKADTGLGERDDEDDDEEDDMGHSRGFMSWRLRQKAVTCSVLCTDREKCKRRDKRHVAFYAFVGSFFFLRVRQGSYWCISLLKEKKKIMHSPESQKQKHRAFLDVGMCRDVKQNKTGISHKMGTTNCMYSAFFQNLP